ncbi:hypothetical protein [Azospirillum sp.]|uniref:hypothetical protein n=1 Tax=Azospirillum sp. TaxID=34012 RepID=UPI003D7507C5
MGIAIRKTIITDPASGKPVAVQISYEDWTDLESRLGGVDEGKQPTDLSRHYGTLHLSEDPMAFQTRIRDEWP